MASTNAPHGSPFATNEFKNSIHPKYKSVDRELYQCSGDRGNEIAKLIELCVKDKVMINECIQISNQTSICSINE